MLSGDEMINSTNNSVQDRSGQLQHSTAHLLLSRCSEILSDFETEHRTDVLRQLLTLSDDVPEPASGQTLLRWQLLAQVASVDLTLAKWFESHLDARSILLELGHSDIASGWWAIWAAEGGPQPLQLRDGQFTGIKWWCSAASQVDFGLISYRDEQQQVGLAILDMQDQRSRIGIDDSNWQAVGMQATLTETLHLNQARVQPVGLPDAYLRRAGFWHGAAGVAACWFGATLRIGRELAESYQRKPHDVKAMYLGDVIRTIATTRAHLHAVAHRIDQAPSASHECAIRALRAQVESAATTVLEQTGRALGAAPFCQSASFARMAADLPVFLRQSHAAFDLQRIGVLGQLDAQEAESWQL